MPTSRTRSHPLTVALLATALVSCHAPVAIVGPPPFARSHADASGHATETPAPPSSVQAVSLPQIAFDVQSEVGIVFAWSIDVGAPNLANAEFERYRLIGW